MGEHRKGEELALDINAMEMVFEEDANAIVAWLGRWLRCLFSILLSLLNEYFPLTSHYLLYLILPNTPLASNLRLCVCVIIERWHCWRYGWEVTTKIDQDLGIWYDYFGWVSLIGRVNWPWLLKKKGDSLLLANLYKNISVGRMKN